MRPFRRLLVANRGEIACRVLRTARERGYQTVAVFSEADASAPHVALADEALRIGPPPARDSYLRVEALIDAARRSGADAIHPGYGFLAESPALAEACVEAGLVFVGAPAEAMRLAGDKARARKLAVDVGVAITPGEDCRGLTLEAITAAAKNVGFPLLVKAAAGGGGRGMRRVVGEATLAASVEAARREAEASFGDGALLLERFIDPARHVEVQIAADAHGDVLHLGERDCSVQRRYQKVIEEAPAPGLSDAERDQLGVAAVAIARAARYRGLGTVEFLLAPDHSFYFLEMNTRLQVEHPVTERVTGLDLVALQLDLAAGKRLPFEQAEVRWAGHAIEARVYAEDPDAGYAPQTGPVLLWDTSRVQRAVRVDAGIATGQLICEHYDPLLAKVVSAGDDRHEAIRQLTSGIERLAILGPKSNLPQLARVLRDASYERAELDTRLLDRAEADGARADHQPPSWLRAAAAALLMEIETTPALGAGLPCGRQVRVDEETFSVSAHFDTHAWFLSIDEGDGEASAHRLRAITRDGAWCTVEIDDHVRRFPAIRAGARWHLGWRGREHIADLVSVRAATNEGGRDTVSSPCAGAISSLSATVGARVVAGDELGRIEAMKVETPLRAPRDGVIEKVLVQAGQRVTPEQPLIVLEEDPA